MFHVAAASGVIVFLIIALGGFGYRLGLWDLGVAFSMFRYGPWLTIAAIVFIAAVTMIKKIRGQQLVILGGSAILALIGAYFPLAMKSTAESLPYIHDITTDTRNPPVYVAVLPLREQDPKTRNPVEYPGEEVAKQQQQGYPDLKTLYFTQPITDVFSAAEKTAQNMGWKMVATVADEGRIEATATTFWFGFKDDVVIRIQPEAEQVALDIRSKSRVGQSDVGLNAKRIRAFIKRLKKELQ